VIELRNIWILWLKVIGPEVDQRENWEKQLTGNLKGLKIKKKTCYVRHSKNTTPKLEQSRPIFLSFRLTAIDRLSNF